MKSQKVGIQSFDELAHVSINVTGEGISQPILFTWDGGDREIATGTTVTAPTSFSLEVPQGNNRLIQILAVYKDSTSSGSMQFFYGDISRSLNLATEGIDIPIISLGSSTQIVDGQVMGRYLTGAGTGPTGKIDILYTAPGKPPMIIERDTIINGWFSLFMLSQVAFSYRLPDGSLLWDGPVDLNSPIFAAKPSTLRVSVPMHQRNNSWSGAANWRPENPQVFIYGWFGNADQVAAKVVCDNLSPSALNRLATGNSSATFLSRVNASPPANLFDGTLSSVYVHGGVPIATAGTACLTSASIAAANFESVLSFSTTLIDGQGKDNAAGFRGPFVGKNEGGFLTITNSATGKLLEATLLPGVSSVIDSFVAFKKSAQEQPRTNFAPCSAMALAGLGGFSPAGKATLVGNLMTLNIAMTPEEASAGTLVALCPVRGGMIAESGYWISPSYFKGSGGGSNTTPYLRFEFQGAGFYNSPQGSTVLTIGKCYEVIPRLYQSGMPFSYPNASGLSLTALSSPFGSFYTTSACAAPVSTATISQASSSATPLYFKATSPVAGASLSVTISDASISFGNSQPIFAENGKLRINLPARIVQNVCYPATLNWIEAPGDSNFSSLITTSSIAGSDISLDPGTGGSFFANTNCTGTANSANTISNGSVIVSYMATTSATKSVSASASGPNPAVPLTKTIDIGAGGPLVDKIVAIPWTGTLMPGQCNQITLVLLNHDNAVVPTPVAFSVGYSAGIPGVLFVDPGCGTSGNSVTFNPGESARVISFIPSAAGATFALSLLSGALSNSANLTVANPVSGGAGVDPHYFYAEVPALNGKKLIGSHQFPINIPLRFPSGATNLQCSLDDISYSACSPSVVDGSFNYIWTEGDAVTKQVRYFRITMPGVASTRTYKLSPVELFGPEFKAIHCDSIIAANTTFIAINSIFLSSNVVCLNQNVVLTKTGANDQIVLNGGGGKYLIGHTTGNTIDVANLGGSGDPNFMFNGDITTRGAGVANLNFVNLAAGDSFLALGPTLIATASFTPIIISGNSMTITGASLFSTSGISSLPFSEPDIELHLIGNQFTVNSPYNSSGTTYGVNLYGAAMGKTLIVDNSLTGAGLARDCQNVGVKVASTTIGIANVSIENLKWSGNGCAIEIFGANSSNPISNLTIQSADIDLNAMPVGSSDAIGISLDNVSSFEVKNNRVVWSDFTAGSIHSLVRIALSGGGSATGSFTQNVLSGVKDTTYGWLEVYAPVVINNFDYNQFIYRGSTALTYKPIYNTANMFNKASALAHGNNLFCSGTSNIWSTLLQNSNSGTFSAATALTNCTHINDVELTSGLCKSVCSP